MSDTIQTEATVADKAYKIPAKLETGSSPDSEQKAPIDIQEAKQELTDKLLTHCETTEKAITTREEGIQAKITDRITELSQHLSPHERASVEKLLAESQSDTMPEDTVKAMVDKVARSSSGLVASRAKEGYKNAVKTLGMDPKDIPPHIKQRIGKEKITPKDVVELFMTADDLSNDAMKTTIRTSMDLELQKALALCPENKFIQLSVAKLQERMGISPQAEPTQQATVDNTPDAAPVQPVGEQPDLVVPSFADIIPPEPQEPSPPTAEQPTTVIEGTFVGTSTYDNGASGDQEAQKSAREVQQLDAAARLREDIAKYQDRAKEARENSEQVASAQATPVVEAEEAQEAIAQDVPPEKRIPAADGGAGLKAYEDASKATTENNDKVAEEQAKKQRQEPELPSIHRPDVIQQDTEITTSPSLQEQLIQLEKSLMIPQHLESVIYDIGEMNTTEIQTFLKEYQDVERKAADGLPQQSDMEALSALKGQLEAAEQQSDSFSFFRNPRDKFTNMRRVSALQKEYDALEEATRKKFGDGYQNRIGKRNEKFVVQGYPIQDLKEILSFPPLQGIVELSERYKPGDDETEIQQAQQALKPILTLYDNIHEEKRRQRQVAQGNVPTPVAENRPEAA